MTYKPQIIMKKIRTYPLFWVLTLILLNLMSCKQPIEKNWIDPATNNPNVVIIRDTQRIFDLKGGFDEFWIPNKKQCLQIDSITKVAIRKNETSYFNLLKADSLENYYRQLICFKKHNGHYYVYVNALYRQAVNKIQSSIESKYGEDYWKTGFYEVRDGSESFWHMIIDITDLTYEGFTINGDS